MSHQTAVRCFVILLIAAGLPAQEPTGQRFVDPPMPRVIEIETTPDIERSEVLRKVIEMLKKEGAAKSVLEDRIGKPIGFLAQISARPDTPFESLQQLTKALREAGIEKFSFHASDEPKSSTTVMAPADAPWRQVRRIEEVLVKHSEFAGRVLVAENNDPVTPTFPQPAVPIVTRPRIAEAPDVPSAVPKNVYRPAPAEDAVVRKFALKYARAAAAARIIEQLYGREVSVAADEQTNSLIVRGNDNRTQEIEALLGKLDVAVPPPSGNGAQAETPPADHGLKIRVPALGPQAIGFNEGASPSKVFSFNVGISRESADELRKRSQELELRSRQLAEQFRGPFVDPNEREKRKELLRATVQQAFAARQALLRAENSELAKRLHALQQSVEMRDRVSQQIIDRRVDDLLNPDKQWHAESPAATVPYSNETTAAEPPARDEEKLRVRWSETSVKVEGQFEGNEEILVVMDDPSSTAPAKPAQELPDAKEWRWVSSVDKAGEYVIELRSELVKIDGGGTAPGLVFQVHNVPNTVQSTSNIAFTNDGPLLNGKVVFAFPKTKVLKHKTDQVLVTVGHIESPDTHNVVPISLVIRRKAGTGTDVKPFQNVVSDNKTSRDFPFEKIKGHIASVKQQTAVAEAVVELRKLTGLDFGNGIEDESRQAWLEWWDDETSCIDNAKDGLREFVVTGMVTANGKPVSGANVRAHVPSKSSPGGQYQLAETHSDSSGRYVLALGIPPFATTDESTWKASFTVCNPPRFVVDQGPIVMTLYRHKREDTDTGLVQDTLEKNTDTIFAGVPVEMNFKLRPSVKPVESFQTQIPAGKARRKHEQIECELVKYQVSEARFYPLVGPAQLVQAHFKSTITSEAGREVVFSDSSHLIRVQPE